MDAVIDLCECSVQIPSERKPAVFIGLQALIVLDDVQFELCGDPGCKLKRNVLMGKGASVSAGLRNDAYRICSFNPLFGRECKSIGSGLFSKPVEFEGVKTR